MPSNTLKPVYVIGVGSTAYLKPRGLVDYPELGLEAATKALLDAGITYDDVEMAAVGYCYGDTTCGQRALYALGMTQIPILNVNNACSTGSSAIWLAKNFVASGLKECTMALGFEKMAPGSLTSKFDDRTNPMDRTVSLIAETVGVDKGPLTPQIFGNGGQEYCDKYGSTWEDIAKIASKNHAHSANNPYSQFTFQMTAEEVLADKLVTGKTTRSMCSPTSDGASCAILASEDFVKKHGLENQAIEIAGMGVSTDSPKLFEEKSAIELTGVSMTKKSAEIAYEEAGIGPQDVSVIELHDCFAANELLTYDGLGLCAPGKAHEIVRNGDNTYGGKYVINPSGGLESKGHPLGATGVGMCFYITMQLRGGAGKMQLDSLKPENSRGKEVYGLTHNLGLGGSCVVGIYKRPSFYKIGGQTGKDRVGYDFGLECRNVSEEDVNKVKSRKGYSEWAAAKL